MQVCRTIAELAGARGSTARPLGFVPTMGALHAGHLALVTASTGENAATLVSIFVNPSQFGPNEDLAHYPRTLERDLDLLGHAGVDVVFAPDANDIYPPGYVTWISLEGPPAARLEAERRPGHFRGVATIVAKLLVLVQADVAYFGQKDAQQLAVVRRMVLDLHLPTHIRAVPTVREADGLALSSRNRYLSPPERRAATVLSRALATGQRQFAAGERAAGRLLLAMQREVAAEPLASLDYLDLADPDSFAPVEQADGRTLALIACRVGPTRLIDNAALGGPAVGPT